LTLVQTQKLMKKMVVLLYGTSFWKEIINFEALVRHGMISPEDLHLFEFADDVDTAFDILKSGLTKFYLHPEPEIPGIAKTQVSEAADR
jgi:predicted Rossmann-fold nucleotide-binding protein